MESIQFSHALNRILRKISLADPSLGPVQLLEVDSSDGFYHVNLNVDNIPKLGVVFPTNPREEPLIVFLLVLPMGWGNSPPMFSTATDDIADLENQAGLIPHPHLLDDYADEVVPKNPLHPRMPAI